MDDEKKVEREKITIEIDKELLDWVQECVGKGTFESPDRAIELAVAYCRDEAIRMGVSQETNTGLRVNVPLDWEKLKTLMPVPEFGCDKKKVKSDGTTNWREYVGHRVLLKDDVPPCLYEAVIVEVCGCGGHIKCHNPISRAYYWRGVDEMRQLVEDLGMYYNPISLCASTVNVPFNYTYPWPLDFQWGQQDNTDGVQHPKGPWG